MEPERKRKLLEPVAVVGGAKFPGGIVASWPLAKVVVSDTGITVALRGRRTWSTLSYSVAWNELRAVDANRTRIVLHGPRGTDVTFGNMFAPTKVRLLVEEIRRRGIPVRKQAARVWPPGDGGSPPLALLLRGHVGGRLHGRGDGDGQ